jgi:hypothetical protein
MGRFDQYATGKLEIEIGGEKLLLEATLGDKRKLKAMVGNSKDKGLTEDKFQVVDDVIIGILKRSYPEEKPEALEGLYSKNDVDFLNKLFIAFGWMKEEDLTAESKKKDN